MKILINVAGNIGGGGKQVAISFINECKKNIDNEYFVIVGDAIKPEINIDLFPNNFHFTFTGTTKFYNLHKVLSKIEKSISPNIVFTVFGPSYWRPKAVHLEGYAIPHHITPESEYFKVISCKERLIWRIKKILHIMYLRWESDAIVTETASVTDRASKVLGESKKYFTVSNTINAYFQEPIIDKTQLLPKPINGEFRLLTLSKYYRHKNIELIPRIVDELKKRGLNKIKFILTIDNENYLRIFGDRYTNEVITIGAIPIWDCPRLYKECDAMFLPTMLECFSASYPEAMIMERPILTSHYDFAKTVCDEAAIYFDPVDILSIADSIEVVYRDENLRAKLVENGKIVLQNLHTAEQRAEMYLEIMSKLITKNI